MISWEKLFIDKIIRPKSKTYTVVQWQFFFLCGKCMRSILMNNRDDCRTICSAAIPFPVWQNPAKYHNKDDFWKPVVNCRTGKGNTKPNLRQTFLFMCFYCFSSVSCDLSERQQGNLYIFWLLNQVRRLVSIWVLPASRWAVPDIHTPYWCSLHQASDCCRYFPSFTGTVTIGLLSICPRITSLKFLSCSPCAVPPFELHSGGAVVLIIASLMSWFSNPKFRGINQTRHFMVIFKHLCLSSLHL